MAQEFKIGRLRFQWSGPWTTNYTYAKDNVVSYQGKTYAALVANQSDAVSFYNDASKWNLILDGKTFKGVWTPNTFYSLGNVVIVGGAVYYCTVAHTSTVFANQPGYWSQYTQGINLRQAWTSSTVYSVNDIVTYGGIVYSCSTAHTSSGTIVASGATANGTTATITFSSSQTLQPFAVGSTITISGFTPTTLTGSYTVLSCSTTQVTFNTVINGTFTGPGTVSGTSLLGLEADQSKWSIVDNGVIYTGVWTANTRYRINDIVKVNGNTYICTTYHISGSTFAVGNFSYFIPDEQFLGVYNATVTYQTGDTVTYGGNVYISNTVNNLGTIPSSDAVDWSVLTPGATAPSEWNAVTGYYIGTTVRRNGRLFQAILDNNLTGVLPQDPVAAGVFTTYNSAGSSGTTFVVASTANASIGSFVVGVGFTLGQTVVSITNNTTVVLSAAPDGTVTNGQNISFIGVNSTYWKLLVPSQNWGGKWTAGSVYQPGDLVVYSNRTYSCVLPNTAASMNRPDVDTVTWIVAIDHFRKNASSNIGDLTTYNNSVYTVISVGTAGYILRTSSTLPAWQEINTVTNVLYVSSVTGVDAVGYGNSVDRPFKSINYAAKVAANGLYNPNAVKLLTQNKDWIRAELLAWTQYQINNNLTPYTTSYTFDSFKTARDTGYILDAIAYDLARGGNSQTVATALAYFAYGSTSTFFNSAVTADMPYYFPILNYLSGLIFNAINQSAPAANYQVLNNSSSTYRQYQVTGLTAAESGTGSTAISLLNYIIYALTNSTTAQLPTPNQGKSVTIFVKTGTYLESLPIVVPANCSILGDDLRSVTVAPAISITTTITSTNGSNNLLTATNITGGGSTTIADSMPIQFIPTTTVIPGNPTTVSGGLTAGQTYYVNGNTISGNQFGLVNSPTTTFTGTLTNLSNVITDVGSVINLVAGNTITGNGIPNGTTITSVVAGSTPGYNVSFNYIIMSANATVSSSNTSIVSTGAPVTLTSSSVSCTMIAGDQLQNMFLLRNGTTLRNMTVTGLNGTYLAADAFTIQRPSGGAYASLDPGLGPNDTKAWILSRSPYVQNVTTFGNNATGLKIDGTLHNGGTKSIVANDFTQVIQDGIGVWCTGPGALTECISVFCYYGYTGYFAEAGGRIRAANGNSSYGFYGVISQGYDLTETPISGVVYNQSIQSQASVQSSLGVTASIVKLNYNNAGSNYVVPTTNLLKNSNNFTGNAWVSDSNITFDKVFTAPTGNTEAWYMIGTSSAGTAYVYQNMTVSAKGATYTNLNISTSTGVGIGATANVTISATGYTVTLVSGGSGYTIGDNLYIAGLVLGGVTPTNNCLITVNTVSGTSIASVIVAGTVPVGNALPYTASIYAYQGTATQVDIQMIFSGSSSMTSAINYNFATGVITPSSTGGGYTPTQYGAQVTTSPGWYRLWFTCYDASGLNTALQYRIYPKGFNGAAGLYTYFYGSQVEQSRLPITVLNTTPWTASTTVTTNTYLTYNGNVYQVTAPGITALGGPTFNNGSVSDGTATESYVGSYAPGFYFETQDISFTSYANYNVTGAGTKASLIGDEIRSGGVFQTVVYSGGAGYLTASNNAQGGTNQYVSLSTSDINTAGNYIGMRVFINSGTGAGQYGYIGYYNAALKQAFVLREAFISPTVASTTAGTNVLQLSLAGTTSNFYIDMPVMFIPTYYTTTVTSTSLAQTTATTIQGGTVNRITVASTAGMYVNMPIIFSGTTFGTITAGYTYYVSAIIDSVTIQITSTLFGSAQQLNSATGSMTASFTAANSYLQGSTTNMLPNLPIQFTGSSLGGIAVGSTYYICDIIDSNDFTISASVNSVTVTTTNTSNNTFTCNTTAALVVLNPILFTAPVISGSGVTDGVEYWISSIVDINNFTVATSIIQQTVVSTNGLTNQITCSSSTPGTAGFVVGQAIIFAGTPFGQLQAETVYYVLTINSPTTFTVSQSVGGGTFGLSTATGLMTARTCPSPLTLANTTGSMVATSTSKKISLSLGIGSMNGQFSTSLFGGVTAGQVYYINTILSVGQGGANPVGGTFQIATQTTANGGTPINLLTKTGSMTLAQVGWDHVTPGTPIIQSLDSTTVYYIEPRLTFTPPSFYQSAASTVPTLTGGNIWGSMAYGAGTWVAMPNGGNIAAYSISASTWTSITLPISSTWSCIAYGNGYFVALNTSSTTGIYSNSKGLGWRTFTMPSNVAWSSIVYSNGYFVAIASGYNVAAYATNFTRGAVSFTSATLPSTSVWSNLAVGVTQVAGTSSTIFVTLASGTNTGAYSVNYGATWLSVTLPVSAVWSSVAWGNNRFVAISSQSTINPIYSFDGINWYQSPISAYGTQISYGQGSFLVVGTSSTTAYTSENGLDWGSRTVTGDAYSALAFGYNTSYQGIFATLAGASTGSLISTGVRAKGRVNIVSNTLATITIFEPGSGYTTGINGVVALPTVSLTDPNVTSLSTQTPRVANGVLGNPSFYNKGVGYNSTTTSVVVTGNGFADTFQTGYTLILNNVSALPSPGANLIIAGNSNVYKVTSATAIYGTVVPNLQVNVQINPALTITQSPANGAAVQIRVKYSQCRLTNHDFLNIGYGDLVESRYPSPTPATNFGSFLNNQTIEVNYGRVFVTSTDQDGNFKVGNLFGVQQATGIITLSASQFGLGGLSSLSLGGIALGSSSVLISQFSTDTSFTANSDSVIPTQRAIRSFLASRLTQGGANTFTGQITAGTVVIGGPNYIRSSIPAGQQGSTVNVLSKMYINAAGVDGNMMALHYFIRWGAHRTFS
jgi:hypothetical protein